MALIIAAVVIGALSQCNRPDDAPAAPPPKRDDSVPMSWPPAMAAQLIGPMLRDPESAQYRDVTYRTRHGLPAVCGEVNAKNGFGGYTGFIGFISLGNIQTTVFSNQTPARKWRRMYRSFCVDTDASDAARRDHRKSR